MTNATRLFPTLLPVPSADSQEVSLLGGKKGIGPGRTAAPSSAGSQQVNLLGGSIGGVRD